MYTLFFKVDVFTVNKLPSRIDNVHLPCFLRILFKSYSPVSLSTLYLQELIMSTFPASGGYCLNHILQLCPPSLLLEDILLFKSYWVFYLFVLGNLHFHFTLAERCSNLPLRFLAEQPVFKQN